MKQKEFVLFSSALLIAAVSVFFSVNERKNLSSQIFEENVEALAQEARVVYNGALYANNDLTKFCCGAGNVRDCAKDKIPECKDLIPTE